MIRAVSGLSLRATGAVEFFRSASSAGASGAQLKRTRVELSEAIEESRRKERVLTDLQTEQRDNRLAYDGPKAIEMSLQVQLALLD